MISNQHKKSITMVWIAILLISPFLFPSHATAGTTCTNRFWVGGTGTWDASDTTHWSATSGGAGGASVPTTYCVVFDASSGGGTVTLGYSPTIYGITMGAFTGTFDASTFSPTLGATGLGSTAFNGSGTGVRTLNMGSGTWTVISGTGGVVWDITTATNLTLNAGASTVKINPVGATLSVTFIGGSQIYNNVWFARTTNTANNVVSGSNTFNDFKDTGTAAHNLIFTAGTTQTVTTFTVSGSSGAVITINSNTTATHALVKTGGGTISSDYLNIQHSVATPASTWYAGTNSTDNQAVVTAGSGWTFTDVPAASASPPRVMRLFEGFRIKFVSGRIIIRQK